MNFRILRDDAGREVARFTTPSGVEACVDTSIPPEALAKFARMMERRIRARELRRAREVLAGKK